MLFHDLLNINNIRQMVLIIKMDYFSDPPKHSINSKHVEEEIPNRKILKSTKRGTKENNMSFCS